MIDENKQNNDQENDYTSRKKIEDFLSGFFSFIAVLFIPIVNFIAAIVSIPLAIYLIVKKERKFIGIGIIGGWVAGLLIFGGCLFMLQGM